jgi:peptidoglycan/LPS O-acetylase OafA/YrhL
VAGLNPPGIVPDYRPDIDGLRAIAVLSVVGYHAFPRAVHGGFTGVDVFFVISGFLISGLIYHDLQRGRFGFKRFYARRFRRIFPALIVVLTGCLAYGWFALAPDEYRELGKQAAAGAGFSSNFLQWSQSGYFDQKATAKPLLHLWSLGVEEQFYFAWPIIIVMAYGRSRSLLYACCGLVVASFIASVALTQSSPSAAFYLPVTRFWELLLGAILAYYSTIQPGAQAMNGNPSRVFREALAWLGLLLIVTAFFLIDKDRAFPGWWALLPTLGTAMIIAAPRAWVNRTILSSRPLVFIGLISYPLYLWHWVLLTFARIANDDEEIPRSWRLLAIAAASLLAWLTYLLVEKPIRFGGNRDAIPRVLVGSMAACGLAGGLVYFTDGGAFRFPAQIRALAAFHYDSERDFYERAYRGGTCFIGPKETFSRIGPQCVDKPDGESPLLVLWGDSHAASLYPGLRAAQQKGQFRIAQFTASACPPLIDLQSARRRNCKSFNDSVIQQIRSLRPDVVILESHWALYSGSNGWPEFDASALRKTVQMLQEIGIKRIVVMGSLPTWTIYQPRVAFKIWRHQHVLKDRSREFLDSSAFAADAIVRNTVAGTKAIFVSPLDLLCDDGACLISTDPLGATPIAWDNDHLSVAGSGLLANLALHAILGGRRPST